MPALEVCPDPGTLRSFAQGQLDGPELDSVEQHILTCEGCFCTLDGVADQDTIAEIVRCQVTSEEPREETAVRDLIEQVRRLCPEAPTSADTSALDSQGTDAGAAKSSLSFVLQPSADEDGTLGTLGGYRLLSVLGEGGMGTVYLAEDPLAGRQAALKTLRPDVALVPGSRERFLREARAAAVLDHDHIVPIYQVGEDGGIPFIAMPLLKGEPLEAFPKREPQFPLGEAVRIGREAAEALAAAHSAGLVHRDVKPANLWLEPEPRRRRKDSRLWPGTADAVFGGADPDRCGGGNTRIHGAGTVRRRRCRWPGRPLQLGCRPLPNAHRSDAFPRRNDAGGFAVARRGHADRARKPPARSAGRGVGVGDAFTQQGCRSPARDGSRCGNGAGGSRTGLGESSFRTADTVPDGLPVAAGRGPSGDMPETPTGTFTGPFDRVGDRFSDSAVAPSARCRPSEQSLDSEGEPLTILTFALSVLVAGGVIIRLKHKDGTVTAITVPDDAVVELVPGDNRPADVKRERLPVSVLPIKLQPDRISTYERWVASDGDPAGLVAILGDSRFKGWSGGYCVAFSPDGKLIASGGSDQFVRLYDAATGEIVRTLSENLSEITATAFSPDSKLLAACFSGQIGVWNLSGGPARFFSTAPASTLCAAFRPDGKVVVAGCSDGSIRALRSRQRQGRRRSRQAAAPGAQHRLQSGW